ncbi:MAG: glycosyltransferase [Candidatus Thermoplasmatota archaeon]|nr:glycosyltransferase [Candidatus Thermoplasmatota archaeon]
MTNKENFSKTSIVKLSVIILTYNRKEQLLRCIETINKSVYGSFVPQVQLIVIDDASTDGTSLEVAALYPSINMVTHSLPKFPCYSLQEALEKSEGEFIIRVDDDNELLPDCIELLLSTILSDEKIAFCGAVSYNQDGKLANKGTLISKFLKSTAKPIRPHTHNAIYDVDLVDNVYIFKKKAVCDLGGFKNCELFPWSLEDALIQMKLKKHGYRIVCNRDARTIHFSRPDRPFNPIQFYHLSRSRVVFMGAVLKLRLSTLLFLSAFYFLAYAFSILTSPFNRNYTIHLVKCLTKGMIDGFRFVREHENERYI